jgi:hypothetical protein
MPHLAPLVIKRPRLQVVNLHAVLPRHFGWNVEKEVVVGEAGQTWADICTLARRQP